MISAIVMAGYDNKWAVKKYAKIVAEHYGEKFIESGYKPLREFTVTENGRQISKPLIQFTLEKLFALDSVQEIIIVGHQMLLEQRLRKFLNRYQTPHRIVNQNSKIPSEVIERFKIVPRKVKHNSIAGNMIKGYAASTASKQKQHALYVASDSPLTSKDFMERFLSLAEPHRQEYALIFPAILMADNIDRLGRMSFKLINDSEYRLSEKTDEHGRQGFRLSSLMMTDPYRMDINTANTAYNLRKALSPQLQLKLFKITRNLGYANVYSKYFFKKDLSITEVENITSAFFCGKLKIIPMLGEESTYDYDGTDYEYRRITEMLNPQV